MLWALLPKLSLTGGNNECKQCVISSAALNSVLSPFFDQIRSSWHGCCQTSFTRLDKIAFILLMTSAVHQLLEVSHHQGQKAVGSLVILHEQRLYQVQVETAYRAIQNR